VETFTIEELFQAYFDCRKSKRTSPNALAFELQYEDELLRLHKELNDGTYTVGPSVAFIVTRPVKREIFAAQFRDRVVHHLLINRLNPLFEKTFIYDSYACRVGKGTLFGAHRVADFIRRCSNNYSRDCYILKLDIQGFFMNINRELLLSRLNEYICRKLPEITWEATTVFFDTLRKVVLANPADGCWLKSRLHMWEGLPVNKSILKMNGLVNDPALPGLQDISANKMRGLPIGNLTSQVFANFYLHAMDAFIVYKLLPHAAPRGYYGRYVDDFVLIHSDKEYLKSLVKPIDDFLKKELFLQLHPKKVSLQHYTKGLSFLGTFIRAHIILPGKRMQGNFYAKTTQLIERYTEQQQCLTKEELQQAQATVNSYLGIVRHLRSRHLRKKMVRMLRKNLTKYFRITLKKMKLK
jgi:retron-type reverse transcriptase